MFCPGSAHLELSIPGWEPPVVDPNKGAKGLGTELHRHLAELGTLPVQEIRLVTEALEYVAELRAKRRFSVDAEVGMIADWLQSKPMTTVDLILYTQDELHILDYQMGMIPVDPVWNEQLMFYAVTASYLAPRAQGATLHIVQPKVENGCSSWYASAADLADFMQRAQAAEEQILQGSTLLHPSDHCTFCAANPHSRSDKGRPLCPPMMQKLYPSHVDEDEILSL